MLNTLPFSIDSAIMDSTMETIVKLNNQTAGRDKIARLIQYTSRFLWHYLQKSKVDPKSVGKLKTLEYTFSTFRKLLRLGKCMDVLYSSLASIHYSDVTIRITSTLSKISMACFLLADHILWVGRSGLCSVDTTKWSRVSNKYWLYALILNLIRDLYEINRILKARSAGLRADPQFSLAKVPIKETVAMFCRDHKDVVVDTVKNACDVLIPLTALGHVNFSPGFIGLLGAVSSIAGIMSIVDPLAKLTPS